MESVSLAHRPVWCPAHSFPGLEAETDAELEVDDHQRTHSSARQP
jgi:hypothetical protein